MQKHLQKLLLIVAMMLVPWVTQSQTLEDYTFSTGVDTTKWVDMSTATTILSPSGSDGLASSVRNIGFPFPFGEEGYAQYSVNTDGNLRLGPTVTGTGSYSSPFSSSNCNYNNPKINFFGCDGYGVSGSHYVKALNIADTNGGSLLVVEFCMGTYTSTTRNELYKWQVHLYSNGNIEAVYGPAPSTAPAVAHQPGLCVNSSDGWVINSSNIATHFTAGSSTTIPSGTWHEPGRYYSFTRPVITCPKPIAISVSNMTAHSFDISWTDTTQTSQWLMKLTQGSTVVTSAIVNDTNYSFTSLTDNTLYTISVAGICDVGDTSPWRTETVRTYCDPMDSLPFVMTFETVSTTSSSSPDFISCWQRISNATSYFYPYIASSTTYNHTPGGSKGTYWYCTNSESYGSVNCIILPGVDTSIYPIRDLQLSLWMRQSSSTTPLIQIGVLTDPTDISTFEVVETINVTNPTWEEYLIRFNQYTGDGAFIGINGIYNNYWYLYMDDITLEVAPDCPRVENLVVSGVTTNSANVAWSESGTATNWEVSYLANGLPTDSIFTTTVTDSSETLTGLQPNTTYTVWVTPVCDSGMAGTNSRMFTTLCLDFDSLPYTYGFEDATGSSSTAEFGPDCWHRLTDAWQYYYPYIGTSSTYAHTGNRGLYWYNYYYSDNGYGQYQYVVLPHFDSVEYPINTLQLRFWAASSSFSYYPTLQVGVITDLENPNSFIPVTTVNVSNNPSWHEYDVPLTSYTGPNGYVAVYTPGSSTSWTCYLDDFTLEVAPPCPRPDNLHAVSVDDGSITIDWDDPDNTTTAWQVVCVPTGLPITSDSAVTDYPSSHPYTFSTLNPGTTYDIYVYAECANGTDYSMERMLTVSTACTPIDSLPYFYGFEGTTASTSGTIDPCWNKGVQNTTTQYPYPNSVHFSGTRSLYFYGYQSSNIKSWAVMPLFNDSIDDLQVSFKMRAYQSYSYYCADLIVGLMTNPYDINTFTPITRCEATSTTTWDSFTVILYGHQSEGRYITFLAQARSSSVYYDYVYLDDVVVDRSPNCGPVTDLAVTPSVTSAMVSWTPSVRGETMGATVEYREAADTTAAWQTEITTDNFVALMGLTPSTQYVVHVTNNCTDGNSPTYTEAFFTTGGFSCVPDTTLTVNDTVGNGTQTDSYIPSYSYYGNGISQQIYLARELTGLGRITSIRLQTQAHAQVRQWDIYLANVSDSSVTSWIVPSEMTQVWSGSVTYAANGWVDFEFSTPFNYTGGNLLVMVNDHTGSYVSGNYAYVHSLPNGRMSRYMYRDGNAYNPNNPGVDGAGTSTNVRCNMIFSGYGCTSEISDCAAPPVIVTAYNPNGATINWAPGSGESSWEVYYKQPSETNWTSVGEVYTNSYTFTTLTPGTDYQAKVVNNCTDESLFSIVSFFVPCPTIDSLPFFEDFNSYGTGTGVQAPSCWVAGSDYGTTYPYIIATTHTGSGGSMYMYNSRYSDPSSYTYFSLPELDSATASVNQTQVVFYAMDGTSSYVHQVVVGVCDDPGNMMTFVPVDTITTSYNVWNLYEVPLNNYTGSGRYITFASQPGPGSSYCYPYVDDLWLERIPSCQRPDSLTVTNVTATTATLQWSSRSEATQFVVEYGPLGFTPGTGTTVIASSNPFTLTGLPANYQGEYYVRNICSATDTGDYSRFPCTFTLPQTPATLPYVCTFEDSAEGRSWQTSSNGTINWSVGSAMVDSGSYAMYISPDGGTTYGNENFSSVVNASAYRNIDFGSIDSSYTISFRAKAGGTTSNTYDALMVFLVDTTDPVISSSSNITSPWGNVNDLYTIGYVRLDTAWNTYTASFDTIHGVHRVAFFWFNQNTGASYPYIGGPAAVDNIRITYSPCVRPVALDTTALTSTTASLTWRGDHFGQYRVAYRVAGAPASTNTYVNTSTNSVTLTGLDPMTNYTVWVQKICGTDSSLFSDGFSFQTEMCENATIAFSYSSTMSTTTSSYGPMGYSFYNYGYVQTLIDSAELANMADHPIIAMAFNPVNGDRGEYYTNMDIYLANVPESDLSVGFIIPDTTTHQFVQVTNSADLSYTDGGWFVFSLDTAFEWDGHSNLLVSVNRRHGSYSSGASFNAHNTSAVKTRYLYQDTGPYDPNNPSGGSSGTGNYVGDLKFISCTEVLRCNQPVVTGITQTYESATVSWTGDGTDYEVNIKESAATSWPATDIHVTGNSYTFTGLMPTTNYTVRVRQDCTADSAGYSDWTIDNFVTDSLPCLTPDSLTVLGVTNATATLDWTPISTETAWQLHVWFSGGIDSIYTVGTRPATVGGFMPGVTYQASVRPLCGSAHNIVGDWGDTVTFTTAVCPDVTGLGTSNVTTSSVTVSWTADPLAVRWILEYGYHGFDLGTGTQVVCTNPTYVVTGLMDDMEYDFRVRAVCGDDWQSEGWANVSATTQPGGVPCEAPTGVSAVVAGNAATISWTANTGNISFEVEYGPRGYGHNGGTIVSANASPATLTDLDYDTEYDVYVRGICDQNTPSAWSTVVSFTTEAQGSDDCDPVTDLAATNVTESSAMLSWTPGPTGDEWEVVLTTAAGVTVIEASTTEHQYALTGLTPGTAYVAKVRTVCGDGVYSTFASTSFSTLTVGIDGVAEPACTIYPNPTSSTTTISVVGISGKVKIAVVDMNGREVSSETLECSGDCAKTMDVDGLAQGAYFVRITGENVSMVRKLIVR